jgi:RNA polymerase sigma factor (sigma-70 family)
MDASTAVVEPPADEGCAAERLFDAHHERLFKLARRLSTDHDQASDLVQETFMRVVRSGSPLPADRDGQIAWLVTALVNLARDRGRRAAIRQRAQAGERRECTAGPEAAYVARIAVQTALARLDARRRAVIVLHEIEGEPVARVATLLGISAITVRWHLGIARRHWQPVFALCTAVLLAGVLWYWLTPSLSRPVSPPAASAAKPAVAPESDGRQVSTPASMDGNVL